MILTTIWRRVNTTLSLCINTNFNLQAYVYAYACPQRYIRLQTPVPFDYVSEYRQRIQERRRSRIPYPDKTIQDYYFYGVANLDCYIDSAFRSIRTNEAYMFINNEYVLINYAPGSRGDRVINGPLFIGDVFPSLVGTAFAEYGILAAFSCHGVDEAFIFTSNLCAKIKYAPGTTDDKILEGRKTIGQMFPFFKGTEFEHQVDAAFESTVTGEAYLFKGPEYALINYYNRSLIALRLITEGFPCLKNTIFASDIGAAFASHKSNEAYLFKDNTYLLLHFSPGSTNDYIITGPKDIVPDNWPSLKDFVPRKNGGLDYYDYATPHPERPQDSF